MEFQHAYSVPVRDSDIDCKDPSLAQEQYRDEVDINVILERFKVTGQVPVGVRMPQYGDFTGVSDYRTALDAIRAAEASFMQLPAKVRARFENDPQQLLQFVSDPANAEEAIRLGLASAKPVSGVSGAAAPDAGQGAGA